MALKKSVKELVAEASSAIKTYPIEEALELLNDDKVVLVDIRDVRELQKLGKLPNAEHAPRGMLEFWVDPESPYHKPLFAQADKEFVLYCGSAWRSALAVKALQDMGMENVAHIEGGFSAWKEQGGVIEAVKKPSKS